MRKVIVALAALLVLPAVAFGQPAVQPSYINIDIVGTGGETGSDNFAGPWDVWARLSSDGDADGVQYTLQVTRTSDGSVANDMFEMAAFLDFGNAVTTAGPFPPPPPELFNGNADFIPGSANFGWDTFARPREPVGSGNPDVWLKGAGYYGGPKPGALVGVTIAATGDLTGDNYLIGIAPGGRGVSTNGNPDAFDLGGGTYLIIPEPASALLLLLAVPFLRRRRA